MNKTCFGCRNMIRCELERDTGIPGKPEGNLTQVECLIGKTIKESVKKLRHNIFDKRTTDLIIDTVESVLSSFVKSKDIAHYDIELQDFYTGYDISAGSIVVIAKFEENGQREETNMRLSFEI